MEWWESVLTPMTYIIPRQYEQLARSWGLAGKLSGGLGAAAVFVGAVLLLWGLFYLGLTLSFGRISSEDRSVKKTLILIAAGMAMFAAWYGAGIVVVILSNLIYVLGMLVTVILFGAILRAVTAGWYAAEATYYSAKKASLAEIAEIIREIKERHPKATAEEIREIMGKDVWDRIVKYFGGKKELAEKWLKGQVKKVEEEKRKEIKWPSTGEYGE